MFFSLRYSLRTWKPLFPRLPAQAALKYRAQTISGRCSPAYRSLQGLCLAFLQVSVAVATAAVASSRETLPDAPAQACEPTVESRLIHSHRPPLDAASPQRAPSERTVRLVEGVCRLARVRA